MKPDKFHHFLEEVNYVSDHEARLIPELLYWNKHYVEQERTLGFRFRSHFHPYVGSLVQRLVERSVPGLQGADTEYVRKADGSTEMLAKDKPRPVLYSKIFGPGGSYDPTSLVEEEPLNELDFASTGPYSVYNWEIFFHIPLTLAIHLSRNQRYPEAQRWLHFIFDPTDDSDGPTPERFWKVKPFHYNTVTQIQRILVNLSTGADPELRDETVASIAAWKDAPFRPHAVARHRPTAYMFKTVMAYLDNLIAWGDSLFRQDTRETINEATQLYVLAANILGPRPQAVPRKGSVRPQTYANLRADLDEFGNALRDVESEIPFDLLPHPGDTTDSDLMRTIASIGQALYFCVPRNEKLLGYWDTVADRLFKIRNSLNIQGIFRQLALFDPPIDPALLAKAAASGLDIGAVVSGANQPLPLVRFRLLADKAAEITQEVKSLGGQLLSTIEKEDGEKLAILRAEQETVILGLAESVRYGQWQEAIKAREGVEKSFASALHRHVYYERLLGKQEAEIEIPELEALDKTELQKLRLKPEEPEITPRDIDVDIEDDTVAEGRKLSGKEISELDKLSNAQTAQDVAGVMEGIGSLLNVIPMFEAKGSPMGVGVGIQIGGMNFSQLMAALGAVSRAIADRFEYEASQAGKMGGYDRREQDWAFQSNAAAAEIEQTYKQLRAAQIREIVAEREWQNHKKQIEHAEQIEEFLKSEKTGKTTNDAFYAYMKREVRGLYGQCFQLAFDVAKKAERALQHELGDSSLSFVQMGYMGGREGLMAGEKLHLDVKRMEMAYHDLNQREYELNKHVSLAQVDPRALLQLRATGRCTVALPEELFDMDGPGHYFRRIKSVALSIPSVTGPYTSVNCTLSLLKSSIRRSPLLSDGEYARAPGEDSRFDDHFGSLRTIVTSSAQNDSGVFDAPGDERKLPFELSGAISEWQLELPATVRQFDYDTIADVILHIRYTAREGGGLLRSGAVANLEAKIAEAEAAGSLRLFSVRHEFPSEWASFTTVKVAGATKTAELEVELRPEHFPYWSRERLEEVKDFLLFARTSKTGSIEIVQKPDGTGKIDKLDKDVTLGLHAGKLDNIGAPKVPTGSVKLLFKDNTMDDLWLAVAWGARAELR